MAYDIKEERDGLFIHVHGDTSMNEIMACNMLTWEHPNNHQHKYHLWDMSKIEGFNGLHADGILISKMDNHAFSRRSILMALVATHPELVEIIDVYKQGVDKESIKVGHFENTQKAREWTSSLLPDATHDISALMDSA